jgi:hypothetical protein
MRYRLRTLLILLAVGPPVLAVLSRDLFVALALGWLGMIVFALFASMSDARTHSRIHDD